MEQNRAVVAFEHYLAAAAQHIDKGEHAQAEGVFKQLIESSPPSAAIQLGIFQVYQARNETVKAIEHLLAALDIDATLLNPAEHVNLGSQLFAAGKFESALDCGLRCLSLNSENTEAHILMAESYLKIGQFDQALRSLRRAIIVNQKLQEVDNKHHFRSSIPHKIWKIENCIAELNDDLDLAPEVLTINPNVADEHYYLANGLAAQGNYESAIKHYQSAIEARPDFSEAHFNFGCTLHAWQRGSDRHEFLPAIFEHFSKAVELKSDWVAALNKMAEIGRQLSPSINPLPTLERALAIDPNNPQAHHQKGMFHYCHGEIEDSFKSFTNYLNALDHQAEQSPLASLNLRVLSEDAITAIGHMAQTPDYLLKSQQLGLRPNHKTLLLAPKAITANPALLDVWSRHMCVVTDPKTIRQLRPLTKHLLTPAWLGRMPDGNAATTQCTISYVQKEWDKQARGPIPYLTSAEIERGWDALQQLGVPRGAWFVALHVREPGYKPESKGSLFDRMRNADPLNYMQAVKAIIERGGWVVRMGEPTMTPMPQTEQLIDYAHSSFKSDWMDVFLGSQCKFFLGGSGGVVALPQAFHVPLIATDFPPSFINLANAWDLYAPKLFFSKHLNRLLTFKEVATPPLRYNEWHDVFEQHGIEFINNTAEEIYEITLELLERLEGTVKYSEEDEMLQNKFRDLYPDNLGAKLSRVGRHFLRTHSDLLLL